MAEQHRQYADEDVDWGGTPPPAPKPEPPAQMVVDATLPDDHEVDEDVYTGSTTSARRSADAGGAQPPTAGGLQPLWLIPTVQAADEELVWESLATTQLRSHALTNPSTATFKDAARFVAFIAVETGGMPRGPRGAGPTLPGAPLIHMAVRTMHDKPEVFARVRAVFEHLRTVRPPNAAGGAGSVVPATATGKLLRVGAFRHFFVEALRVVSQGTLDTQVAEQVAECEWRAARSHSSVSGALALKAAKSSRGGGAEGPLGSSSSNGASGIPLAAFADKLLHFVVLFIANGGAFAAPLERHVSRLLSYISVCVLQLDVNDAVSTRQQRQQQQQEQTSRELFSGESAAQHGEAPLVPQPPPRHASAPTAGFLPPARPWTHKGAASAAYAQTLLGSRGGTTTTTAAAAAERNAATAPQLRQVGPSGAAAQGSSSSSAGRLPLIMTKRQVDDFDEPDDLADATVSIGVGSFAARAQSRSAAGTAAQLGSSLYSSKISTDATSLRKALKAFELYAHHHGGPGGGGGGSQALVPCFPGDDGPRQANPSRSAAAAAVSHGTGSVQVRVSKTAVYHPRNAGGGTRMSGARDRVSRSKSAHKASWNTGAMSMRSGNRDGDPMADADLMSGASVPSARRPRNPDVARMVSIDGLGLV